MRVIDLNADVGERPEALDEDRRILGSITSANIACGFHAGTAETMRVLCEVAVELGVSVGAHLSYLDREGFGRRDMNTPPTLLAAQVTEQIGTLQQAAAAAGTAVSYVKPHGALYNRSAYDAGQAIAIAAAVADRDPNLRILCPPRSTLATAARVYRLEPVSEGFADRAYLADGSLAPRSGVSAVLDPEAAAAQALSIATRAVAIASDGTHLNLDVRSLCLHSDTPGAAELAAAVRSSLTAAGIAVEAFA